MEEKILNRKLSKFFSDTYEFFDTSPIVMLAIEEKTNSKIDKIDSEAYNFWLDDSLDNKLLLLNYINATGFKPTSLSAKVKLIWSGESAYVFTNNLWRINIK